MPRPRREPTDDWAQLHLLITSPEQHAYEVLRPVVLFGQPISNCAQETGVPERTPRRCAFIDAARNDANPLVSGDDGLRTRGAALGAYVLASQKRPVACPDCLVA
jgi:hypothetical protein